MRIKTAHKKPRIAIKECVTFVVRGQRPVTASCSFMGDPPTVYSTLEIRIQFGVSICSGRPFMTSSFFS